MSQFVRLAVYSVFAAVLILAAAPQPGHAITSQGVGLEPIVTKSRPTIREKAYFNFNLVPGTKTTATFRVINYSLAAKTLNLFPADATTTSDGTFAMLNGATKQNDVGSWMSLSTNRATLAPKAEKIITVTVSTPYSAAVGDHLGGIVAQDVAVTNQILSSSETGVKIISRVGLRVYATVGGAAKPQLEISTFTAKRQNAVIATTITLKNTGNTMVGPTGLMMIKPLIGEQNSTTLPNGIVLASGAEYSLARNFQNQPLFIKPYRVTATIQYGTQTLTAAKTVWLYNRNNMCLLLAGVAISGFVIYKYRRFKKLYIRRSV